MEGLNSAGVASQSDQQKSRALGRQIGGEEPPSDPTPEHGEDRVHDLAKGPRSWPPMSERLGKKGLDQSPRGIGQIGFPSAGPMRLCRRVAGVPIALPERLRRPPGITPTRPLNPFRDGG